MKGLLMIVAKNLKKTFEDGITVLEDINMTIEDGDIYGLVGRSGAGKSTLLRCINGLTDYNEGSLTVDGHEIKGFSDKEIRKFRWQIGMIFQHFSLLERKTVAQNVALPMECQKVDRKKIDERVKYLCELVGLGDKMNAKPRSLSGGQKQRVAIARALTMEPKILLCDEATSALDPNTTNAILDLLNEINQKTGITIIIVTHQMEVVQRACKHISILEGGRIAAQGETKDVFLQQPPALKRLLGTDNLHLPTEGENLQFAWIVKDEDDGTVFPRLVADLGVKPTVVEAQLQVYLGEKLSSYVINIDPSEHDKIVEWLDKNNIRWQIKEEIIETEKPKLTVNQVED